MNSPISETDMLIDEDYQQINIPIGKKKGDKYTADDCTVNMLKYSESVSISKGHFMDDHFIFEDEQEIENTILALTKMLEIMRERREIKE